MSPKEAKKTELFVLIFLRLLSEQDVAPFPGCMNAFRLVAKASQDLIPPPFLMRMHDVKERLKLRCSKKKVLQIMHSKGLFV